MPRLKTRWLPIKTTETIDTEAIRKILLLNVVSMVAIGVLLPMGGLALRQGNWLLALSDVICAALLIGNLIYLKVTGNHGVVSCFGVGIVSLLFFYILCTGGVNNSAYVWYYTFPLFSMFLLGTRGGTIANLLLFIPTLAFLVLAPSAPFWATYPTDLKLRFIPSYIVVFCYSYIFEHMREKIHFKLTLSNEDLHHTVNELEAAKDELKRSGEKLEFRVRERTVDLDIKNRELHQEISERLRVESELTAANDRFIKVLDSIDVHIYVVDMESHRLLFVNQKMEDTYGRNLTGAVCREAFKGENRPCSVCPNQRLAATTESEDETAVWEYMNHKTQRWFVNATRVIHWTNGRRVFMIVSTDVTDRKQSEMAIQQLNEQLEQKVADRTRELAETIQVLQKEIQDRIQAEQALKEAKAMAETASKAKSEFLANMSHELRTPLNHIIGFTELVMDDAKQSLKAHHSEYLGDVLSSSHHLLSLINDILDLSKIEAGKITLLIGHIPLSVLLKKSLLMIKEKAFRRNIQLNIEVDDLPGRVKADERRLKQILYNLLSNAVKFSQQGGHILLKAEKMSHHFMTSTYSAPAHAPGTYILISVVDSGIGLSDTDLQLIFNPFEQVDSDLNRKHQGTGLGLPLSRELVELHGGQIWARSDGVGRGAAFHFSLPCAPE